mgnify:CR=1 FL=1|jgi:anaerobic magnesium-protoporphyrin IX monomethyl ester cyclase
MKLLLLFPPTKQSVNSHFIQTEGEGIGSKPPLGILYIASYVLENSIHEVTVLDMMARSLDDEEIVKKIRTISPHVIGVSCWTDFWYPVYRLINLIKKNFPDVHITLGGPHVGIYPKETLSNEYVDSIIVGDGESSMLNLLNYLTYGEPLFKEGVYLKTNPFPGEFSFHIEKNLDNLPIPARKLLPLEDYTSVLAKDSRITTMLTSRGCPFKCVYCKLNFQSTVYRSAENVIDEMEQIQEMGIRELEIYDDTFTWSEKRVEKICRGIIQRKIVLSWAVRDRVSSITEKTLELMKRAGCNRIHLGIETGNSEILKNIKKKITLEEAVKSVTLAKKAGLKVLTYFMVGLPGETEKEVMETIDFAISLNSDYAEFNICIPYPGTEMYLNGISRSIIPADFWHDYATNPVPDFIVPNFYEEYLSKDDMIRLSNLALKKFYFRPRVIFRELFSCSSFGEFRKKSRMGLSLAKNLFC